MDRSTSNPQTTQENDEPEDIKVPKAARRELRRVEREKRRVQRQGNRNTFSQFHYDEVVALKGQGEGDIFTERRRRHERRATLLQRDKRRLEQDRRERKKLWFYKRFGHWFKSKRYNPETFGMRPAYLQFLLYILNLIHGATAFGLILRFQLTNPYTVPPVFATTGLFIIIYFTNWMDVFGSMFGMLTALNLERFDKRARKMYPEKDWPTVSEGEPTRRNTLLEKLSDKLGKTNKVAPEQALPKQPALTPDATKSKAPAAQDPKLPLLKPIPTIAQTQRKWRITPKANEDKPAEASKLGDQTFVNTDGKELPKTADLEMLSESAVSDRKSLTSPEQWTETTSFENNFSKELMRKQSQLRRKSRRRRGRIDGGTKKQKCCRKCLQKCGRLPCCTLYRCCCRCIARLFLNKRRSVLFLNIMGYSSWIMLQSAWLIDVFYTAYYHWYSKFSSDYREAYAQCGSDSRPSHCDDFDAVYYWLLIAVGITFSIRNVLHFLIGMCFSEALLTRQKSPFHHFVQPDSCSASELDYSRVPDQLLRPYVDDKPWIPVFPNREKPSKGGEKKRKLILNAKERQTENVLQTFKDVRRAKVITGKRRADVKIRKVKGAKNTNQMPAELLTPQARAWLSGDETDSTDFDKKRDPRFHIRRHHKRKRTKKDKEEDSNSLILIHDPKSRGQVPIREAINLKLDDLSDRISTDETWSGHTDTLFDSTSRSPSDIDETDKLKRVSDEQYFNILRMENDEDNDDGLGGDRKRSVPYAFSRRSKL